MRRLRRTKIVATLGPASSDQAHDRAPVRGRRRRVPHQHEPHLARRACASCVAAIRAVEAEYGRPIGILADLQGPKLRVGTFDERRRDAEEGRRPSCSTTIRRPATSTRVHLPHPEILAALEPGHTLLLDDGKVRLRAIETLADSAP